MAHEVSVLHFLNRIDEQQLNTIVQCQRTEGLDRVLNVLCLALFCYIIRNPAIIGYNSQCFLKGVIIIINR